MLFEVAALRLSLCRCTPPLVA